MAIAPWASAESMWFTASSPLVLHLNKVSGILGRVGRVGDNHRHCLASPSRSIDGQCRLRRLRQLWVVRCILERQRRKPRAVDAAIPSASASPQLTLTILACANGERTNAAWSMRGRLRSAT